MILNGRSFWDGQQRSNGVRHQPLLREHAMRRILLSLLLLLSGFQTASAFDEHWDENRPPKEWPKFTIVPGKLVPKRTPEQSIAYAQEIEQRWIDFKSGRKKQRVTIRDSGNAIDALLTVSPTSPQYRQAWSLFVRLRKIDREVSERLGMD